MYASTARPPGPGGAGHTTASTANVRSRAIGAGSVRYSTTTSADSRGGGESKPGGASHGGGAPRAIDGALAESRPMADTPASIPSATNRPRRPRRRPIRARIRLTRAGPAPLWAPRERSTEDGLTVLPRYAIGDVGGQIREPRARPRRLLRPEVPAPGHGGGGAEHEAVGESH